MTELGLGFLVSDVSRLLRERFNETARSLGLTLAQARSLLHLSRNEGISQVALARLLEIQPITLLRQLDRLEESGLIERRADPRDRRAQQLYLTHAGKGLLAEIAELSRDLAADAYAGMSEEELRTIIGGLSRIKDNLSPAEALHPPAAAPEPSGH